MSDPKTPKDTPETETPEEEITAEAEASPQKDDQIEDAEIIEDSAPEPEEAAVDDAPSDGEKEPEEASDEIASDDSTVPDTDESDTEVSDETPEDASVEEAHDTQDETEPAAESDEKPADDLEDVAASEPAPEPEPEPIPEPEPAIAAPPPPPPAPEKRKGGFMGVFMGGVVSAGLGFGLCYYMISQGILPFSGGEDFEAERAQLATLEEQMAALRSEVGTLASAPAEDPRVAAVVASLENVEGVLGGVQGEIGTLQSEIEAQSGIMANFEAQMEAIAALPAESANVDSAAMAALQATLAQQQADNAAMQQQLSEMAEAAQAEMDAVRERAGALQSETQAAVDDATNRAFAANLAAALENGTPFAAALAGVTAELPAELSGVADSGVETLLDLQRSFPTAARAGLSASLKANLGDDPGNRIMSFLRTQVGARSLTAREGDDPDAVLSRAQAAVDAGDLSTALSEIAALPAEGQDAMSGWTGDAQARVSALAALDALTTQLNTN